MGAVPYGTKLNNPQLQAETLKERKSVPAMVVILLGLFAVLVGMREW
jgi:hypothetical protein